MWKTTSIPRQRPRMRFEVAHVGLDDRARSAGPLSLREVLPQPDREVVDQQELGVAREASARWLPMKPAAPVTRMLLARELQSDPSATATLAETASPTRSDASSAGRRAPGSAGRARPPIQSVRVRARDTRALPRTVRPPSRRRPGRRSRVRRRPASLQRCGRPRRNSGNWMRREDHRPQPALQLRAGRLQSTARCEKSSSPARW